MLHCSLRLTLLVVASFLPVAMQKVLASTLCRGDASDVCVGWPRVGIQGEKSPPVPSSPSGMWPASLIP